MSCSVHDSPQRRRLLDDVRTRLFTPAGREPRYGAEVELIPVRAADGRPVPIHGDDAGPGTLNVLLRHGESRGWFRRPGPHGVDSVATPDGSAFSFEPGGQLELATRPRRSVDALVEELDRVVPPLIEAAGTTGIRLLGVGIDPFNPLDRACLQLQGERYRRMHRYLGAIGDAGPRMMLQTAAIQINVELGPPEQAELRWRVLNGVAPFLTALFANSPVYSGLETGFASYRARQWRRLDRRRTGLLGREDDPAAEYTDFALAASWIFGPEARPAEPFLDLLLRGEVTMGEWRRHLTTLFPEVRPRGFLEVRGIDALPPRWYAAPLVFLAGLLADRDALLQAREITGAPDSARLQDAARTGMADPRIAGPARALFELALATCDRHGLAPASVEIARDYVQRYTARGRSPADDGIGAAA
ncbi:MAG: glutamate-cysteine ligase family protein [Candidatus Longimicrobiales bacterium M2_2A_002]